MLLVCWVLAKLKDSRIINTFVLGHISIPHLILLTPWHRMCLHSRKSTSNDWSELSIRFWEGHGISSSSQQCSKLTWDCFPQLLNWTEFTKLIKSQAKSQIGQFHWKRKWVIFRHIRIQLIYNIAKEIIVDLDLFNYSRFCAGEEEFILAVVAFVRLDFDQILKLRLRFHQNTLRPSGNQNIVESYYIKR